MSKITFFLWIVFFSFNAHTTNTIVVGSKNFSENVILAEMVSLLLESKGLNVERKFSLGGTKVAFDSILSGDIHVYPDYTGTGYTMILNLSEERDADKIFEIVSREFKQRYDLVWSPSIGFNNTYAFAVRSDDERFKNIQKLSELSNKVQSYTFGAPHEFMERQDGYIGFTKNYDLNFSSDKVKSLDSGLTYDAIKSHQLDMIVAYSTDGRIKAYNLRLLEEDKNYFPPYYASLLAKTQTLKRFPALSQVYEELAELVSEEDMMHLNDQVDRLKMEPRTVAHNFLIQNKLLTGKVLEPVASKGLLRYALQKKGYLFKLLKEHLTLSIGALLIALVVSIPTGIILTRRPKLGQVVFPLVNTIQTIPSLALLGFLIPFLGIGFYPALLALCLYSLLPLIRNTYIGIQSIDRGYIEASRGVGLNNWQILFHVEIPLAMPVILAGLRTATVIVIGTTTIAALVGAGGFGDPIFRGVATVNSKLILLGAIPAALLAIIMDRLIGLLEVLLVSKGIRTRD